MNTNVLSNKYFGFKENIGYQDVFIYLSKLIYYS